jgi:hypothetical protein
VTSEKLKTAMNRLVEALVAGFLIFHNRGRIRALLFETLPKGRGATHRR